MKGPNMKTPQQNGFAHVVLLVALATLTLGAVGYAYKVHRDNSVALQATPVPIITPYDQPKPTEQTLPVPAILPQIMAAQTGTFKIPELNIEMTLPAGLTAVTYAPMYDFYNRPDGYGITTATMLNLDPMCTAKSGAIGNIAISGADGAQGNGSTSDIRPLGGQKSLYLYEPNGSCSSRSDSTQIQQTELLKKAIMTARYSSL
jgi:hypothetical protein